jgi:hypothetical protein
MPVLVNGNIKFPLEIFKTTKAITGVVNSLHRWLRIEFMSNKSSPAEYNYYYILYAR